MTPTPRSLIFLLLLSAVGCKPDTTPVDRTPVSLVPGPPVAGVAEGPIDFPMGTPLGGFSSRCGYLGGDGKVDKRQSAYALAFTSSAGIQTRTPAKALWLENGDQSLVILKADVIYVYDGLVEELEDRLQAATGLDLDGRVAITSSHSHNAPANFSDQIHFYLGGDRYNEEVFQRFATSLEQIALAAYDTRQPAKIGMGIATDWDPDSRVYSDRREQNDSTLFWDDQTEPGYGKDPHLWVLRVDTLDDEPLGLFFDFGIHGTMLGGDNAMVSVDSTGHIENAIQERFDTPVVVTHWQGAGGDAAPVADAANGHEYAKLEGLGERAVDAVLALWADTPTQQDAIRLETVTHAIPQGLDVVQVTRGGTTDLRYAPFDPSEDYQADDIVYDAQGKIISPIDEFNAQYGGVFCGYDDPLISVGTIGSSVYPYDGCMNVELISFILNGVFELTDFWEGGEAPLPLPDSLRANTTASRLGPLAIREPSGEVVQDDLLLGFFPGETTATYTEQFRRRASAELGMEHALVVGYAQDHEGYLLIPEDWLLGGYEPNINIWGPLQGEHIMEGVLAAAESHLLSDTLEPQDLTGAFQPTSYPDRPLPTLAPDATPGAGTVPSAVPDYIYTPLTLPLALQPEPVLARGQGAAQLLWEGGDPGVDLPTVVLERQGSDGSWQEVLTPSGRPITDALPDILLTYTPDPLYPFEDPQAHWWWAAWQAVGPAGSDRLGLEEGTYRLHVYGQTYAGGAQTWPWPADPYEVTSDPFEIVPAELSIQVDEAGVAAWIAGPEWGWRLLDLGGASGGSNPLTDATLSWELDDGSVVIESAAGATEGTWTRFAGVTPPEGAVAVEVVDAFGNMGRAAL